jgi:AraC-like DNA-binding protein
VRSSSTPAPARPAAPGIAARTTPTRESLAAGEACRFWRAEELDGLELLHATFVRHSFAPHTHDGYAIGVIERGVEQFRYCGQNHDAPAGSVVLVNPGEVHTGHSRFAGGFTYRMLYPEPRAITAVAVELGIRGADGLAFPTAVVVDPQAADRVRALHASFSRSSTTLERQSRLLELVSLLVARHGEARVAVREPAPEHRAVRRARDYIEEHAGDNLTLDELAREAGLSVFHFVRVFRHEVGLPPHAWHVEVRVRRARELLRRGTPPALVAAELGFVDQSHLTREFKRRVGVTPGRYAGGAIPSKT